MAKTKTKKELLQQIAELTKTSAKAVERAVDLAVDLNRSGDQIRIKRREANRLRKQVAKHVKQIEDLQRTVADLARAAHVIACGILVPVNQEEEDFSCNQVEQSEGQI